MNELLLQSLRVMLFGMLGIFAVIVVIYIVIVLLNRIFSRSNKHDTDQLK